MWVEGAGIEPWTWSKPSRCPHSRTLALPRRLWVFFLYSDPELLCFCLPENFAGLKVTVPHILPLLCLMEGEDLWADDESTGDILLRTLEAARSVAASAKTYRLRAEAKLRGRVAH